MQPDRLLAACSRPSLEAATTSDASNIVLKYDKFTLDLLEAAVHLFQT
jgi:hypothetical protein